MAGLYIHIPFCKSRCIYCAFYSTTQLDWRQRYVDAVCKEIGMRVLTPSLLPTEKDRITTVYLGGGTPSQLTPEQLTQLVNALSYKGGVGGETTIEVNPDDITAEYAATLSQLGFNRVSMGVQTFDNQRLQFLHRRHTAEQVPLAIRYLRQAGICNISIDLMYGFPNQTPEDWLRDIEAALALNVEHISAYCLSVEEGTVLYEIMRNEEPGVRNEEAERRMYELLTDKLEAAGYEHYEISNFARSGFRSLHNSSYWTNVPYIGIGAAAHSYDGRSRSWNVSDIKTYMETVERGERSYEEELLDDDTRYNDRITTALRACEGLDLTTLSPRHRSYCEKEAERFLTDGLLRREDNRLILTRKGLFVSDYIMSSLIYI